MVRLWRSQIVDFETTIPSQRTKSGEIEVPRWKGNLSPSINLMIYELDAVDRDASTAATPGRELLQSALVVDYGIM